MKMFFGIVNKNLLFGTLLLSVMLEGTIAHGQHYTLADKGSKIEFSVNSKGTPPKKVKGTLNKINGKIIFDPKQTGKAAFDITINTGSLHTGDASCDAALKSISYFNIPVFPKIHFVSASVKQDHPGGVVYQLEGNLTIKGVTKPAKIQFTATQTGKSYLFRGTTTIDRLAYGVGEQGDIDKYVSVFIEVRTN